MATLDRHDSIQVAGDTLDSMDRDHVAAPGEADPPPYQPHVGESRQYWRDIILGVNDGLVSMVLLVAGVVGGGLTTEQVLLTSVAGAIAGAVSMAAGEYLATKSQDEVLEGELALERVHLVHHRQSEVDQLRTMFRDMGLHQDDLEMAVAAFNRSDEAMLNAMKALEFGAIESERRSPFKAMAYSGLLFLVGSMPSVLPFVFVSDPGIGLVWAGVFAMLGLFAVGVAKTRVTRTNPLVSGLENLVIAGLGGVVAFYVGDAVGNRAIG
jgi:VIT1/CCC1 family predicted Fe2+/Mn2+ transporter